MIYRKIKSKNLLEYPLNHEGNYSADVWTAQIVHMLLQHFLNSSLCSRRIAKSDGLDLAIQAERRKQAKIFICTWPSMTGTGTRDSGFA